MKRIAILGSTGSIGKSAIEVILNFPDFIELDYKLLVGMVIRPPSF
ncbi:MAG: hypothetical protein ACK44H_09320, partial [Candidatus Kryptonium sp.]